jgi:hypothetical protein
MTAYHSDRLVLVTSYTGVVGTNSTRITELCVYFMFVFPRVGSGYAVVQRSYVLGHNSLMPMEVRAPPHYYYYYYYY